MQSYTIVEDFDSKMIQLTDYVCKWFLLNSNIHTESVLVGVKVD